MMHPWFDVIMTLAVIGALWSVIYVLTFRVAALLVAAIAIAALGIWTVMHATSDYQIVIATVLFVVAGVLTYRFGQELADVVFGRAPAIMCVEWWLSREDDEP